MNPRSVCQCQSCADFRLESENFNKRFRLQHVHREPVDVVDNPGADAWRKRGVAVERKAGGTRIHVRLSWSRSAGYWHNSFILVMVAEGHNHFWHRRMNPRGVQPSDSRLNPESSRLCFAKSERSCPFLERDFPFPRASSDQERARRSLLNLAALTGS